MLRRVAVVLLATGSASPLAAQRPASVDRIDPRVVVGITAAILSHWPAAGRRTRRLPIPTRVPSSRSSNSAARVLGTAKAYIGVPYSWGGTSPATGFDCSGFVQYVFAKHDVRLPRTSRAQARTGERELPSARALRQGDLVFFAEDGGPISHVAIYAGDDRIIHSSSSGGGVRLDDLHTRRGQWFVRHMVAARRVTPDGRGLVVDLVKGLAPALLRLPLDPPDHAPAP